MSQSDEKPSKYVMGLEQAHEELTEWFESMDIAFEPAEMDEESREDFEKYSGTLTRALRTGHLVIQGDDLLVSLRSRTRKGELIREAPLRFGEPRGSDWAAMDSVKKGDVKKMYAMFASVTETDMALMNSLAERDLAVVRAIMQLFLAAR